MTELTALTDHNVSLVADTSTVINLIATGSAEEILSALPHRVVVVDVVLTELESGRARGHTHADRLAELVDRATVDIVSLGTPGMTEFERLVIGDAVDTLDDGEAGTIAYAVEHSAVALIDERKAERICADRYPSLHLASTVDVLTYEPVSRSLGSERLADAIYNALRLGRMRVPPRQLDLVVRLVGFERAALCPSLPRRARTASASTESP
jgi:predicted nucleic acid-binding protein